MIKNVATQRGTFTQTGEPEPTLKIISLEQEKIEAARSVTAQGQSVWSCGPNQVARAMTLLSVPIASYPAFMQKCPRVCGPGPLINDIQSSFFGWLLARTFLYFSPMGPPPVPLSHYATQELQCRGSQFTAKACQLGSFFGEADQSMRDSLRRGAPWLALIGTGPFAWHYWTIVACDDEQRKVHILETNQTIRVEDYDRLAKYMEFTPAKTWAMDWAGTLLRLDTPSWLGTFNCIEFHADNPSAKPVRAAGII